MGNSIVDLSRQTYPLGDPLGSLAQYTGLLSCRQIAIAPHACGHIKYTHGRTGGRTGPVYIMLDPSHRWCSYHLYYHEDLDRAVIGFVLPTVLSVVSSGWIDSFFFIRY